MQPLITMASRKPRFCQEKIMGTFFKVDLVTVKSSHSSYKMFIKGVGIIVLGLLYRDGITRKKE